MTLQNLILLSTLLCSTLASENSRFFNGIEQDFVSYIVNTKQCQIPDIKPFSEEVRNLTLQLEYIVCNTSELLTYTTKSNNTAVLHIRKDLTGEFSPGNFSCCYSNVSRHSLHQNPDIDIEFSKCEEFENDVVLYHQPVIVQCSWNDSVVYENVHNPVVIKDFVKNKQKTNGTKPINVLFIVIDSISRLNFIRTMPKTRNFLLQNNFVEMKGYNKIGENTFPNFMALLTGFNGTHSVQQCNPHIMSNLDKCPMIWYDYRDLGYVTAYVEDYDSVNTFTYGGKKGFTNPPTDYYFKSYLAAAERLNILSLFGMPYCTGPETSAERIMNLAKDFVETFRDYPSFGIFWMNTFSHNALNSPSRMDGKVQEFFQDIKSKGVLDENIVIMLSDHGMRFGKIMATRTGWFESRLPVNFISVPKTFQDNFPAEYENLRKNSKKLTNTFDMYMTLQHILVLSNVSYQVKPSVSCPKCLSLFEEIPDRSCEDAGIAPEWCTCI